MRTSVAGARYAKALADVVLAPNAPLKATEALTQLQTVQDLVTSSPELKAVLATPAIPAPRKRAVLVNLANQLGLAPLMRNFLLVLLDHKRVDQLGAIHESFSQMIDEAMGFVQAEVTSPAPLTDSERSAVEAQLQRISGKRIRMQTAVDPNLLGGVVARIGSTVYDGSLKGQLEGLRRKLTSESADYKAGI